MAYIGAGSDKRSKDNQPAVYNLVAPTWDDGEPGALQIDSAGNLKATLATGLDKTNDNITVYPKSSYVNVSASGVVLAAPGRLMGLTINSNTRGTVKLWDNPSAGSGTVIHNTITFGTGERFIPFYGEFCQSGLYATIGGTADLTFQVVIE